MAQKRRKNGKIHLEAPMTAGGELVSRSMCCFGLDYENVLDQLYVMGRWALGGRPQRT